MALPTRIGTDSGPRSRRPTARTISGITKPHTSFLDFARLIRSAYPRAYHFSFQPEAYAKEIAYSPYISEQNGDNRDLYRRNIIALEAEIGKQLELFQWTMNNGQLNHKS